MTCTFFFPLADIGLFLRAFPAGKDLPKYSSSTIPPPPDAEFFTTRGLNDDAICNKRDVFPLLGIRKALTPSPVNEESF